jgi:hypothetical protein
MKSTIRKATATRRRHSGVRVTPAVHTHGFTPSVTPEALLPISVICARLGLTRQSVETMINDGRLGPIIRHTDGGKRYMRESDVQAYIEGLAQKAKGRVK